MKKMFSEYFYKLDNSDLTNIWNNCLFVFDTNILLSLYKYSEETRNTFFLILEEINQRLWLPHQIGYEYNKNRLNKIKEIDNVFDDAINAIQKPVEQIKDKLVNMKYPSCEDRKNCEIIKNIDRLSKEIIEFIKQDKNNAPNFKKNDFIREKLSTLYEDKIGNPYSYKELKNIYAEAKQRYEMRIPPGYEDAKTKENNDQYGDLVIWKQIIAKAKEVNKPIMFITDDKKEDWWWIAKGQKISLRPELIKEFTNQTGEKIWMYTAEKFMEYAKLGSKVKIDKDTINEVKEVSKPVFENKYSLTDREFEILDLLVMGKSNYEIANELLITTNTVKAHVFNILQKLNVHDRVEAAVKTIRENILPDFDGYYDL